jgi:hypothetical protein
MTLELRTGSERGTIIPLMAMVMLTLVAFLGLAFDAAFLYFEKRRVQTAADAGAIAGAQELLRLNTGNVTTAARKDAQLNRFTHGTNGVDVTVNNPPLSGARAGNSKFVEVIVSEPRPTWFMNVVGVDSSTVRARAVAGLVASGGCVYALNRNTGTNDGISMNGTTSANFNCGVYSNSNFRAVGGACISTPSASYSGSYDNHSGTCGPSTVGQGIPSVDPIAGRFTMPSTSPCTYTNFKGTTSTVVLDPGVYCKGITFTGSVDNVVFNPGTYVIAGGGMRIAGLQVTGTGVTFFNTYTGSSAYDSISITGGGTVSLTAPTSGPNAGLLFYQDPSVAWASNNGSTVTGNSTSTFDGIMYFPTTDLTYSGNSSTNGYTMIVAYNLAINGNSTVGSNYGSLPGGVSPFSVAAFVE